ncbi:TRAP transporter small permease, partial [Desulfosporosinus sp. BICA1-9]
VILTPVAISLSLAYCAVKGGHVSVGLLVERFPKKVQKIIDFITGSIVIVSLVIATWYLVERADMMRRNQEVTTTILIPYAPFILIIAVGVGMLTLVVFGKVLNSFVKEGDQ